MQPGLAEHPQLLQQSLARRIVADAWNQPPLRLGLARAP
jgi:hypothetical protein